MEKTREKNKEVQKIQTKIINIVASASLGHRIDILALWKCRQEFFQCHGINIDYKEPYSFATLYLRNPKATIQISKRGSLRCLQCKSENTTKLAIKKIIKILADHGFLITKEEPEITINNIVCLANIEKKIGCGIIQKAFPEAKKRRFGGESFLVPVEGGNILIFLNGKILGLGFKNTKKAKETMAESLKILSLAIEKYGSERAEICKIERVNPMVQILKDYVGKEEIKKYWEIEEGIFEEVELLITQFCKAKMEDSLGAEKKTIVTGAFYLTELQLSNQGIIKTCRHTQKEVAEIFQTTDAQVRKGFYIIKKTLFAKEQILY